MYNCSDVKAEFAGGSNDATAIDAPHLLKIIQSFQPNVFNSTNSYNQKYGKKLQYFLSFLT